MLNYPKIANVWQWLKYGAHKSTHSRADNSSENSVSELGKLWEGKELISAGLSIGNIDTKI